MISHKKILCEYLICLENWMNGKLNLLYNFNLSEIVTCKLMLM